MGHPVSGNLFHHAVEMFLKGCLAHVSSARLKRLGHDLPKLWEAFKGEMEADATLNAFDGMVTALDRYERLRYPDEVLANGMASYINLVATSGMSPKTDQHGVTAYEFVVEDIDRLVEVLFDKGAVNPRFFTMGLNATARDTLEREPKARIV